MARKKTKDLPTTRLKKNKKDIIPKIYRVRQPESSNWIEIEAKSPEDAERIVMKEFRSKREIAVMKQFQARQKMVVDDPK